MASNITQQLNNVYRPVAGLFVYKDNSGGYSGGANAAYYLETRPVKNDGTLGPARPVSREFITQLVMAFRAEGEKIPHGVMPSNMLFADSRLGLEHYVWYTPPGPRMLYFSNDKIPVENREYNMPGCVYCVYGNRLYVYAFKGKKPSPSTKLLYGPFYNYYADGAICLGSAKTKFPDVITWKSIMDYWETLFWKSENSHMMKNPMKENLNLNIAIKNAAEKPFDTDGLLETGFTIAKLLHE